MKSSEIISVTEAAALCGVGRTTVGYWIRSKKIHAKRISKRNYGIHVDDLVYFLKRARRPIPPELGQDPEHCIVFPILRFCYDFHNGTAHGGQCAKCLVRNQKLYPCFQSKGLETNLCPEKTCQECLYYRDMIQPRVNFIHQIETPACVIQDLFFWGANSRWAELCGLPAPDFVGMGIERVVHSDCLAEFVALSRKMGLGDSTGLDLTLRFNSKKRKNKVRLSRMSNPEGCWLALG